MTVMVWGAVRGPLSWRTAELQEVAVCMINKPKVIIITIVHKVCQYGHCICSFKGHIEISTEIHNDDACRATAYVHVYISDIHV